MGAETASLAQSRDGFVAEIQGTLEELKQQSVADKKTRQDVSCEFLRILTFIYSFS
jgi:hypothetical protein